MKVYVLEVPPIGTNCFILCDPDTGRCAVIDPGGGAEAVISAVEESACTPECILLTHGHYDHIYGFKEGLPSYPVFLSEEDHIFLTDPHYNGSIELFDDPLTIDGLLPYPVEDEDEIKLGNFFVKVIATPFHTGGSVCFYLEKEGILFSGDTLFSHGIGRYDLKGACPRFLESSLRKLMKLPEETVVYPGHGRKTTIGEEKRFLFQ